MRIGFSGTRKGMTQSQVAAITKLLDFLYHENDLNEFHHGDCVGADSQASKIAKSLKYKIVGHPPTDSSKRAFCEEVDVWLPPALFLERNHDIVNCTDIVLFTPAQNHKVLRGSGTWAAFNYIQSLHGDYILVKPDGKCDANVCSIRLVSLTNSPTYAIVTETEREAL